jgi:hypothetical protein
MQPSLISRLIGANWRTSLTGAGTALCAGLSGIAALSKDPDYAYFATLIPAAVATKIAIYSGGSAVALHILKSFLGADAANVSATASPPSLLAASTKTLLLLAVVVLIPVFALPGCAGRQSVPVAPMHPTHSDVPDCIPGASGEHLSASLTPIRAPRLYPSAPDYAPSLLSRPVRLFPDYLFLLPELDGDDNAAVDPFEATTRNIDPDTYLANVLADILV